MTTMSEARKPFLSITSDIDDEAIERIARAKGVPRLSDRSEPARLERGAVEDDRPPVDGRGSGRDGEGGPEPGDAEPAGQPTPPDVRPAPTPRARISYVKAGIPDYALTALKTRAIEQRVSLNHLILSALRQAGIPIEDADMVEDGRRLRGSRAQS